MIIKKFKKRWLWWYNRLHDYLYLYGEFQYNNKKKVDTVYAGSSYVIFGINNNENTINLALPSQDIYYSSIAIKKAIKNNAGIKKVILGLGYYSLYCDLSKSKSKNEMGRIVDVYYPLFKDMHNMDRKDFDELIKSDDLLTRAFLFLRRSILKGYLEHNSYFSSSKFTRDVRKLSLWENQNVRWSNLNISDRKAAALVRTISHEKQFKYKDSCEDNINVLMDLVEYCRHKKVKVYVFIAPMSDSYLNNMSKLYQNCADKCKCKILSIPFDGYIDCNKCGLRFDDKCFVDPDHLSDVGAQKLTEYLDAAFNIN